MKDKSAIYIAFLLPKDEEKRGLWLEKSNADILDQWIYGHP
jgi:hypothetical protein